MAPDFRIAVTVSFQAITVNGVIVAIPGFKIAMIVGYQVITVIIRMEKQCDMVGLMTITIPGVVLTVIAIL